MQTAKRDKLYSCQINLIHTIFHVRCWFYICAETYMYVFIERMIQGDIENSFFS